MKCWNKTAEYIGAKAKKGVAVLVEGELQVEQWEKDGTKHSKVVINASSIQLVGRRDELERVPNDSIPESDIPF